MKRQTFAIAIPTLNRWDLLQAALQHYIKVFTGTTIYVLDNGRQPRNVIARNLIYMDPGANTGVAASWNKLLDKVFTSHEYGFVLNDDVLISNNEKEIEFYLKNRMPAFAKGIKDWSVFIISKKTFEKIGRFDENFKAYFEDNDYEYRMKMAGIKIEEWIELNPMVYRRNSTMEKKIEVADWSYKSRDYYVQKWGGLPKKEKFKVPFDGKQVKSEA